MYVTERDQPLSDIAALMRQKEAHAMRQDRVLGGGLAAAVANQIRDRPELEREMERLEKACAHVGSLVMQLEGRLQVLLVPRPESGGAGSAESNPGSSLGQSIRTHVYQLDSTAARLIALMDSLAV